MEPKGSLPCSQKPR